MRLIDADDLRDIFLSETCVFTPNDVLDYIDSTCTVDAVPVVRCKDCTHATLYKDSEGLHCTNICGLFTYVMDDDYCSYGKRKDGVDICSK